MNKYVGVVFKSKKETNNEDMFIVSQDLIKRGILSELYVKMQGIYVQITNKETVLEWIKTSDDKSIYVLRNKNFIKQDINDIKFDDYIRIFNSKTNDIGQFIIEKYLTFSPKTTKKSELLLSVKIDDVDNRTFCEYYNKSTHNYLYTERVLGLDKVITDKQLKTKIQKYIKQYKKESQ